MQWEIGAPDDGDRPIEAGELTHRRLSLMANDEHPKPN